VTVSASTATGSPTRHAGRHPGRGGGTRPAHRTALNSGVSSDTHPRVAAEGVEARTTPTPRAPARSHPGASAWARAGSRGTRRGGSDRHGRATASPMDQRLQRDRTEAAGCWPGTDSHSLRARSTATTRAVSNTTVRHRYRGARRHREQLDGRLQGGAPPGPTVDPRRRSTPRPGTGGGRGVEMLAVVAVLLVAEGVAIGASASSLAASVPVALQSLIHSVMPSPTWRSDPPRRVPRLPARGPSRMRQE